MHRGFPFALGIEGYLMNPWKLIIQNRPFQSRLRGAHNKASFGGITDDTLLF